MEAPERWNQFRVLKRTNNNLEAWNRAVNQTVGASQPTVSVLVTHLQTDDASKVIELNHLKKSGKSHPVWFRFLPSLSLSLISPSPASDQRATVSSERKNRQRVHVMARSNEAPVAIRRRALAHYLNELQELEVRSSLIL